MSGGPAKLLHLGTRRSPQRKGHARNLPLGLREKLRLGRLEAETDGEAVDFYRWTGFRIEETAGQDRHVRYHCTLLA